MKVNLKNAVKSFYPNPSFEQIYFEAVANAMDAGATKIEIKIEIKAYDQPDSLSIVISDNGSGFADANFGKFSRLMEVDAGDHKGLGRLVFLAYFRGVEVVSFFNESKKRVFSFDSEFTGESDVSEVSKCESKSIFSFNNFQGNKVKSYAYLTPGKIKASLIDHFFPVLFTKKENGESLEIKISLVTEVENIDQDFRNSEEILKPSDLPALKKASLTDATLDFFQKIDIYYSFQNDRTKERSLKTSLCVDGRAMNWDLIPIESIPGAYQIVFLFISDYFKGTANASRQRLELPDQVSETNLRSVLRTEIGAIIETEIPAVVERNQVTVKELDQKFPHLQGYYANSTGLIVKNSALEEAQKSFFLDQKKLLESEDMDDSKFEKAMELSARALMEYVLYREKIIGRLKDTNPESSEEDIHDILIPLRQTFHKSERNVHNNNVWILDDKYMSYNVILSDQRMSTLLEKISIEDESTDSGRPDIAMIFSKDPETAQKVDVVIVELKKHGLNLAKNEEVTSQLKQRARKLLKFYPDKIERIWFYGITDINPEFRVSLKEGGYSELFSHGQVFFKRQPIIVDEDQPDFKVDLFVMTYEALISDAESRNSTFVQILKDQIAGFVETSSQ